MSSAGWMERLMAAEHRSAVMAIVEAFTRSLTPDDLGAMPPETVNAMYVDHVQHAAEMLLRAAGEHRGDPEVRERLRIAGEVFTCAALRLEELRLAATIDYREWQARLRDAPTASAVQSLVNAYVEGIPLYNRLRLPHAAWQALTKSADLAKSAGKFRELTSSLPVEPELAILVGECFCIFEAAVSRLGELARTPAPTLP